MTQSKDIPSQPDTKAAGLDRRGVMECMVWAGAGVL